MEKAIVLSTEDIFEQGNLHMANKLKHFGSQGQEVVKYIISKLRKYQGEFFECNKTIADNVGCSVRTVQNAIKRAEQLEIFVVSTRKEETLNGKMRQTSNKIQLLSYEVMEVVKEVVEEVRNVASKVVKTASKVVKKAQKVFTPKKSSEAKNKPSKGNTYKRKELVPEWMEEGYKRPEPTEEERLMLQEKVAKLKAKLGQK